MCAPKYVLDALCFIVPEIKYEYFAVTLVYPIPIALGCGIRGHWAHAP